MKLILVRHGQTEWNQLRKLQGQKDSPLTARGRLQADLTGKALLGCSISHFYCSDAGRALETAERIRKVNPSLPVARQDARLRELNYGNWEGMFLKEIEAAYPELYKAHKNEPAFFQAPGGETFGDLKDRFLSFLVGVSRIDNANCLVVTHGGLIRVALLALTMKGLSELNNSPPIREASISALQWTDGNWILLEYNNAKHLDGFPM
jgi:phosphoserine phosphatase